MAIDHHKPQVFSPFWEEGRLPIPYLAGSMSIYLEGNSYDPNYSTVMAMVVYHPHITHLRIFEGIFWRTFFSVWCCFSLVFFLTWHASPKTEHCHWIQFPSIFSYFFCHTSSWGFHRVFLFWIRFDWDFKRTLCHQLCKAIVLILSCVLPGFAEDIFFLFQWEIHQSIGFFGSLSKSKYTYCRCGAFPPTDCRFHFYFGSEKFALS